MSKTGDYKTMRERLLIEVGRSDTKSTEMAGVTIASAINRYRHYRFWFNASNFTLAAVAGQSAYTIATTAVTGASEIPWDFVKVLRMEWRDSSNSAVRGQVEPASIDEVDDALADSGGTNGPPEIFTYHNDTLILAPAPDQAYTISVEYVKDIGTPGSKWFTATGTFVISDPDDSTTEISEGYTNSWFTHGEELIRQRAKRMFYSDYMKDAEGSLAAAEAERVAFSELNGVSIRRFSQRRDGWT